MPSVLPERADAGNGPVEVELKLAVPEGAMLALEQRLLAYGPARTLTVDSIYYDTAARTLRANRAALRLRSIGDGPGVRWVQTFKNGHTDTALTRRGEWETPVDRQRLELDRLADSPLRQLLGPAPVKLAAVFRTRFERRLHLAISAGGTSVVELALDRGHIQAGRRREAFCELELEVRRGAPAAVFELALELIGAGRQALALRPAIESKAARGYRLADRLAPAPVAATAAGFQDALRAGLQRDQAARRLVDHGVNRVLANVDGAVLGADPEFVHQARVALRRTRTALRLLAVACRPDDPVARELSWMSKRFGAMRDWDVLVTQWLPLLAEAVDPADRERWSALVQRAERQRRAMQRRLAGQLCSPRFARSALRLLQWTQSAAPPGPELIALAPKALARGRRKLLASGRELSGLSARDRHRVRILAKRQRYAIELLAPFAPLPEPARAARLLARLQQALGEANDAQLARSMLPSLTTSRRILDQVDRWARRGLRRTLPRASNLIKRLERLPR